MTRSRLGEALEDAVEKLNAIVNWHELPVPLGILNLIELRNALRDENLHDTSEAGKADPAPADIGEHTTIARSTDGGHNDLSQPGMGAAGARFGRNVPLAQGWPDDGNLLHPNPRAVSDAVLARSTFQPAEILNLLAAAWIQFMTHDWFAHDTNEAEEHILPPPSPDGLPMAVAHSLRDPHWSAGTPIPPVYRNRVTHWWDGSQLYGSDADTAKRVRTFSSGHLRIGAGGRLLRDPSSGLPVTGFNDNWWLGLDLMHSIWVLEHNSICDHLAAKYPSWDDNALFDRARLINSALMAKIHTVEWTTAILQHPTLQVAMRANWWGLQGEASHDWIGRISEGEAISGIPASETDHHGAPFQMTEEFVSVYRMHPLLPDELHLTRAADNSNIGTVPMSDAIFQNATAILENNQLDDLIYSFGRMNPGALTLNNYPNWLRNIRLPNGRTVDLAAVDILRDRERGVPRYCAFRRMLRLPVPTSFSELTTDPALAKRLEELYEGDIEKVDALVGMFGETPPRGFGFSDTAFRIFILMASRRLKSDRFFTRDYTAEVYTPEGLHWVDNTTMVDVLLRHFPSLRPVLEGQSNAFTPWRAAAAETPCATA